MNTITRTLAGTLLLAVAILATSIAWAASPPVWVNYQGVLRDNADHPLDGSYDMVLRFYSGLDEEILIDRHTTAQGGAVTVAGGLFDVLLGGGVTADGSGPGSYGSLVEVFRDYNEVYLEVQIGADAAPDKEVLSPRTRVVSAAYALNASNLGGLPATSLLRSNESDAYSFGTLTFNPGTTLDLDGTLNIDGMVTKATTDMVANFNADLLDGNHASAFAAAGHGHTGGEITGPVAEATEASNSNTLGGFDSGYFLNTSPASQHKTGTLWLDTRLQPGGTALEVSGGSQGGFFWTSGGTGLANVATNDLGIYASGTEAGGSFRKDGGTAAAYAGYGNPSDGKEYGVWAEAIDTAGFFRLHPAWGTAEVRLAYRDAVNAQFGVWADGSTAGGRFLDSDDSGWAYVGYLDEGISAHGNVQGGYFEDDDSTGQAHVAYGDRGIEASGSETGAYFHDSDSSGRAYVGHGDTGITAAGTALGGYFEDLSGGAIAYVAQNSSGISAQGSFAGGQFTETDSQSYAHVASNNVGIDARGEIAGGYFEGIDSSGSAWVALGDRGIHATGRAGGGYFGDTDSSGEAWVASGNIGISAYGTGSGGYFEDSDGSGYANVGDGNRGIAAYGGTMGGYFADIDGSGYSFVGYGDFGVVGYGAISGGNFGDSDHSGYADVGIGDRGIWANGSFAGGTFSYTDGVTIWADVAKYESSGFHYTITGNGQKNFVQNHPEDPNRVIVYASLEGDEVGTYTRGTARLVAGEARVPLGETFKWVTHPDVGLTAHVTPRSPDAVVYVASVATDELVVRNVTGFPDDASFDYIVLGLRIGFERSATVRDKEREAPIPDDGLAEAFYTGRPEFETHTPLARFVEMAADVRGVSPEDLSLDGAVALKAAIRESGHQEIGKSTGERPGAVRPAQTAQPEQSPPVTESASVSVSTVQDASPAPVEAVRAPNVSPLFPVTEAVELGDLLVLDPEKPGWLRRCVSATDANAIGIAVGEMAAGDGSLQVTVALSDLAIVKADAGFGEIRAGDLLTTSFTPGHAMRAAEAVPGTIIGKALEPLQTGTGLIKVLVMPR